MKKGQIVVVVDTSNYKASYSEKVPFKAELYSITDYPCYWVKSLATGKEYELYESQILEGLSIDKIEIMLDISQYGAW